MALPWQAQAKQPVKGTKPAKGTSGVDTIGINQQRGPKRDSGIDTIGINQQRDRDRGSGGGVPTIFQETWQEPRRGGGGGGPKKPLDFKDSAYNAQIAALDRALRDYETGTRSSTQRYGQDFMQGLRSLGYRTDEGFQAAPDVTKFADEASAMRALRTPASVASDVRGSWDYEGEFNPFSSATRGTRTSRDEFAGRGMLRSSDFAKSYAEFQDRLNQQLEAMTSGRTRYLEDAARGVMQQRAGTEESKGAAEREARTRAAIRAAGGIV